MFARYNILYNLCWSDPPHSRRGKCWQAHLKEAVGVCLLNIDLFVWWDPHLEYMPSILSVHLTDLISSYCTYTVMAKNISSLAILSENATLLSENCCSCKCFGTCMFIFFVCIGTTQKTEKKNKIWYNSTQNPKNALDKIIGTLNLIFGSTPFGKNNWNQSLPVTMNEFLTPL